MLVGRIARAHGLRGQVVVRPETDFVEQRFATGARLWARSDRGDEQLTIGSSRIEGGRVVVGFEGFATVDEVERLAGLELRVPEEALAPLEPGTFYQHQLVGCVVETATGDRVGEVTRVDGGIAGAVLAVNGSRSEILVPLAAEICVDIDVRGRRIRIVPPEGLLELNETKGSQKARLTPGRQM